MKYRRLLAAAFLIVYAGPVLAQCVEIRSFKVLEDGDCGIVDVRTIGRGRLVTIATDPDSASQVLTFTGNSADADTFTIGATVYTTETGGVGTAFEVNDAASAALFIVNLCAAINDDGVGDGTDYFTGGAHPTVTCSASDATTLTVTAIVGGSANNTVVTTTTAMNAAWGAATLADVVDPIAIITPVDSATATEHGFAYGEAPLTDTEPARSVIEIDWTYYLVSVTGGAAKVAVSP